MDKIRVLLADDHTILRKGLRSLLEKEPTIDVVGEAEDGKEAVKKAEALHPDVVVVDIAMPGLNGLEACRQIKKCTPGMKIIVLTVHANEEYVLQSLRAGVSGYLIKSAAPRELVSAIHAAWKDESYLSPRVSRTVVDEYLRQVQKLSEGEKESFEILSPREREVLQLIADGHTTKKIAELLYISVKTVETHRDHLKKKLNIMDMAELVRYAIRRGLIVKDDS
jgi:two-component system response regulator NreC